MTKQNLDLMNPSINSAKLRKLEEIKKEQARIAAEESAEMDRLSKLPLQKPKSKDDNNNSENNQEFDKIAQIKRKQANIVQEEADEMERLVKEQHDEIEQRHHDKKSLPDDVQARIDNYNLHKMAIIKQQQAHIAAEEAKQMDRMAKQQRSFGSAESRLAAIQKADKENFERSGGYQSEIFTREQVVNTNKFFNGTYIGMLLSLNLFMFIVGKLTPLVAMVFATQGICVLLLLNRNIMNYVWGAVAMAFYTYQSYQLYGAGDADFLTHVLCLIMQPIGFLVWSNVISKQTDEAQKHENYADESTHHLHTKVEVRNMSKKEIKYAFGGFLIIYAIWYMGMTMQNIFSSFEHTTSATPHLGIFLNSLVVMGQILMILRFREQWLVWLLVNSIAFWVWLQSELPIMAGQYALLSVCAVLGYYLWTMENKYAEQEKRKKSNELI